MQIRITLLDDALYPYVSQFFLQHLNGVPLLGRSVLAVSRVLTTPGAKSVGGFARFDELLARASEHETAWHIQFVTLPQPSKPAMLPCPCRCRACAFRAGSTVGMNTRRCPFSGQGHAAGFSADVVEWGVSVTYDHLRLVQAPLYFDGARTREQGLWAPVGLQPGLPRSSRASQNPVHAGSLQLLRRHRQKDHDGHGPDPSALEGGNAWLTPKCFQVDEDYIFISALNQYSYCPLRCYWMFVEHEYADNEHTIEGTLGHARAYGGQTSRGELFNSVAPISTQALWRLWSG